MTSISFGSTRLAVRGAICVGFLALCFAAGCSNSHDDAGFGPNGCPGGYIRVPADATYAASDFCLSKYEIKDVHGSARSVAVNDAWLVENADVANEKCTALGPDYRAASNDDWQTVARNIESVAENWSGGAVDSGFLNLGNADVVVGAAGSDGAPCATPGATTRFPACEDHSSPDFVGKRTHRLSNGELAWDLGGNHQEWVTGSHPEALRGFICSLTGADQVSFGPVGDFAAGCPSEFMGDGTIDNAHGLGFEEGAGGSRIIRGGGGGGPIGASQGLFYANTNMFWNVDHGPTYAFRCVYTAPMPAAP